MIPKRAHRLRPLPRGVFRLPKGQTAGCCNCGWTTIGSWDDVVAGHQAHLASPQPIAEPEPEPTPPSRHRRGWRVLAALCLGIFSLTGFALASPLRDTLAPGNTGHIGDHDNIADQLNGLHFDVRDFGAKGDGVTDDRVAIQAAIDAASPPTSAGLTDLRFQRGGIVFFPPGVYNVSAPGLVMDTTRWGVTLVGAGTINYYWGHATSTLSYTGTTGHLLSVASGHDNTFQMLGFEAASASYAGDLVLAGSSGADGINLLWDRCAFVNRGSSTATNCLLRFDRQIISKVQKCSFNGNSVYHLALAYNSYSVANTVDDCFFTGAQTAEVAVLAGYSQALRVQNCTFEPRADGSAGAILSTAGSAFVDGLSVTGCWFGDCNADGGFWIKSNHRAAWIGGGNFFGFSGTTDAAIQLVPANGGGSGTTIVSNDFYGNYAVDAVNATSNGIVAFGNYVAGTFLAHPGNAVKVFNLNDPPTVTGSRGGNAALANLLATLAGQGVIVNSTTA